MQLRNRLKQAVQREDYEEAARIRDQIRKLEEG
jgi:protein-arginine kinase activator protein McsA